MLMAGIRTAQGAGNDADASGKAGELGNERCMRCQKELSHNDVGAYKKFVNRGADCYLCIGCLAEHFGISVAQIEEKIAYFKAQGCTLFV